MRAAILAGVACALGMATVAAQTSALDPVAEGHRIFIRSCAPCHGTGPGIDGSPNLPGTATLQAKYKGAPPAALEQRSDLDADVLRAIVRNGSGAMPMFRKTELTDAEIMLIAGYLKASASHP